MSTSYKEKMKFGCLVVTYNRLEKLKKSLDTYAKQLSKDDCLIVVDNGSDNDTKAFLRSWNEDATSLYRKYFITVKKNIGATYGFKKGLEKAFELNLDWCLICDDDAYLENMFINKCKQIAVNSPQNVGAICSKVIFPNGKIQLFHRRFLNKRVLNIEEVDSSEKHYEKDSFDIDLFSFVGICLRVNVVTVVGYPDDQYYIWYDDTEYSIRVRKHYQIKCYSNLTIIHDSENSGANGIVSYKEYYGYRNRLIVLKKHFSWRYVHYYIFILYLRCLSNYFKCPARICIIVDAIRDYKRNITGPCIKYLPSTYKESVHESR